jgi:hypothetical protein
MTGRYESKLSADVAQPRAGQTFHEGVPIASHALEAHGEKVKRGAKAQLDLLTTHRLHHLGGHAVPCHGAALHGVWRIDLHGLIASNDCGPILVPITTMIRKLVKSVAAAGAPVRWRQPGGFRRVRNIPIGTPLC